MPIVDRRKSGRDKGSESRKRFYNRHRRYIKKRIDQTINSGKSIKDLGSSGQSIGVDPDESLTVGRPGRKTSGDPIVIPGNDRFRKGEKITINKEGQGQGKGGQGQGDGLSEDEFEFVISQDEFRELLFDSLEIPNMFKKSTEGEEIESLEKAGFTRRGIPGRLHIMRTYIQAIGRHMADGKDKEDEIEIDDEDLRYRNIVTKHTPISKAVVYCVMDTSGSMGEHEKTIAKTFYLIVYMFLTTKYKAVEVIFVKYHSEAREVTEEEFFTSTDSGCTYTAKALQLCADITKTRLNLDTDNVYMLVVSDGGDFELEHCYDVLKDTADLYNYIAYLEVSSRSSWLSTHQTLIQSFMAISEEFPDKVGCAKASRKSDIWHAISTLFRKG